MDNVQIRVRRTPQQLPVPEDFELIETSVPSPASGQFLARACWLALDPYPLTQGALVPARGVCEVIQSRNDVFNEGELVEFECGLQKLCISDGAQVHKVNPGQSPAYTALGVLGLPGLLAYVGMLDIAKVKAGETVLVSAASNAAGSVAGQIALMREARVIGIAGLKEKCDWVERHARFHACVSYRTESLDSRLRELAPRGVNVFFDSTGGDLINKVLTGRHLATNARVVLNDVVTGGVPAKQIESFTDSPLQVFRLSEHPYQSRYRDFLRDAIAWFGAGRLAHKEDIVEGLDQAPAHFCRMMRGENFGRALVRV